MSTKKQKTESQDYEQCNKQKSLFKSQNKRKRTTRKQAFQDGKTLIECQYCPIQKRRKYQSYPALYTHVNLKHPGCRISSARQKQTTEVYPVFKMMNILKKQFPQNQQVERSLITLKNITCLLLAEELLKKQEYCTLTYKDQDENLINIVIENALLLAQKINISTYCFITAQKGRIFRYEHTKVFPISFGQGIARYFSKRLQFSSRLYVSLIILECVDQKLINNQERIKYQQILWGDNQRSMKILLEYWQKWKQILTKHEAFLRPAQQQKSEQNKL